MILTGGQYFARKRQTFVRAENRSKARRHGAVRGSRPLSSRNLYALQRKYLDFVTYMTFYHTAFCSALLVSSARRC